MEPSEKLPESSTATKPDYLTSLFQKPGSTEGEISAAPVGSQVTNVPLKERLGDGEPAVPSTAPSSNRPPVAVHQSKPTQPPVPAALVGSQATNVPMKRRLGDVEPSVPTGEPTTTSRCRPFAVAVHQSKHGQPPVPSASVGSQVANVPSKQILGNGELSASTVKATTAPSSNRPPVAVHQSKPTQPPVPAALVGSQVANVPSKQKLGNGESSVSTGEATTTSRCRPFAVAVHQSKQGQPSVPAAPVGSQATNVPMKRRLGDGEPSVPNGEATTTSSSSHGQPPKKRAKRSVKQRDAATSPMRSCCSNENCIEDIPRLLEDLKRISVSLTKIAEGHNIDVGKQNRVRPLNGMAVAPVPREPRRAEENREEEEEEGGGEEEREVEGGNRNGGNNAQVVRFEPIHYLLAGLKLFFAPNRAYHELCILERKRVEERAIIERMQLLQKHQQQRQELVKSHVQSELWLQRLEETLLLQNQPERQPQPQQYLQMVDSELYREMVMQQQNQIMRERLLEIQQQQQQQQQHHQQEQGQQQQQPRYQQHQQQQLQPQQQRQQPQHPQQQLQQGQQQHGQQQQQLQPPRPQPLRLLEPPNLLVFLQQGQQQQLQQPEQMQQQQQHQLNQLPHQLLLPQQQQHQLHRPEPQRPPQQQLQQQLQQQQPQRPQQPQMDQQQQQQQPQRAPQQQLPQQLQPFTISPELPLLVQQILQPVQSSWHALQGYARTVSK